MWSMITGMLGSRKQCYWRCIAAATLLFGVSCRQAPVYPSLPFAIAIAAAPDILLIGDSSALVAVDVGTGEIVDAQWSSSNPAVAFVSGDQLSASAAGRVTITAIYQGARATASVKVVPNFAGTYPAPPDIWGFAYLVECVNLSPEGNFCAFSRVGDVSLFRLELVQTKDSVSGRIIETTAEGDVTGEIDDLGRLMLRGTIVCKSIGGFPSYPCQTIESWSSYLESTGAMHGTFTLRFLDPRGSPFVQGTQEMRGISHGQ